MLYDKGISGGNRENQAEYPPFVSRIINYNDLWLLLLNEKGISRGKMLMCGPCMKCARTVFSNRYSNVGFLTGLLCRYM
jgi:hypothetical protein